MRFFPSKNILLNHQRAIKFLLTLHISILLLSVLTAPILEQLGFHSLTSLLALSSWGLKKQYYWQILTHVLSPPIGNLNFSFILDAVFSLYFLQTAATAISQIKGLKNVVALYIFGALLSGAGAALYLSYSGTFSVVTGLTPALYALLAAWMFLASDMQILIFFTIPIKIKWVITGILASTLLIDFSNSNFIHLITYGTSILFGYFYALLVWKIHSPFDLLHPFERPLIKFSRHFVSPFFRSSLSSLKINNSNKIYDFNKEKKAMENEKFLNKYLDKIQKEGKNSLNFFEKWKLGRLSKKMQRKNDL